LSSHAVIDAIRAQSHRRDQRHDLRPGVGRAGTLAEIDGLLDERLDPEALGERRGQHDPSVRHHPLIIEGNLHAAQSERPVIVHHEGDLLRGPRLPSQP